MFLQVESETLFSRAAHYDHWWLVWCTVEERRKNRSLDDVTASGNLTAIASVSQSASRNVCVSMSQLIIKLFFISSAGSCITHIFSRTATRCAMTTVSECNESFHTRWLGNIRDLPPIYIWEMLPVTYIDSINRNRVIADDLKWPLRRVDSDNWNLFKASISANAAYHIWN